MREPRVALVSIGLGRVRRGFERLVLDLFGVLEDEGNVTLYRGADPSPPRQRVPPFLPGAMALARRLPVPGIGASEYREYRGDCLAYALCLVPELVRADYDLVHVIDPPLIGFLEHLKRAMRLRAELLFTNACHMPPEYYPRTAHVHHVAEVLYREALAQGVPQGRVTLVPCGLHADRFAPRGDRAEARRELRARHAISPDTFVALSVSAVKRTHKRVDHLVAEMERVPGDVLLWIDGSPEDPELAREARERLGARCRVTHVPSAELPDLYHLADVFVHAALEEAFGLAIVEAMASGLPVLVHDAPHFAWLTGEPDALVDMRARGALAGRILERCGRKDGAFAGAARRAESVRARFDWASLAGDYRRLHRSVVERAGPV